MRRVKNSVGIWAFGPTATRFMPGGYHPGAKDEGVPQWTSRAVHGLAGLLDGLEFHYPGECNERTVDEIRRTLSPDVSIYCLALGLFSDPKYALGSFINPKKAIREETVTIACAGVDLAADLGAHFIIWPGGEGYNYPFQVDHVAAWENFIDGIARVVEHAHAKGVTVLLEHKNSEPAMRILMRDIGMTLFVIRKVKDRGVPVDRLKINMDWQHLIMNGEPLAEYAALLMHEGALGHHHGNSGWGTFDDDNMVATQNFMETLALAVELQDADYGVGGERVGFDLFPYTEDPVAAVRGSILHWEFLWEIAASMNRTALADAREEASAVDAYQEVFRALGLDAKRIAAIVADRKAQR
jgi:xylose isomerase